ncbi:MULTISPECIES: HU family DNA-binding protein [unclassified Hyphomonas]|jgi:DNA-binding protein HU-beta|uniref:HU family DNA-binding protein n=1 Tax=unclassified Hyphomonas TaxID=2630699 RepID=UPI000458BEE9|nr:MULTISPECIES: HU family DNA-binding protein [unclassified Hyphomonas]KCZ45532.1 transcriptional regulator [Hyphomonas sp. CY54-11-8]RAN41973.1 transcriptional regulator [Hyphomonas sp. GM-8P]
MAKKPVAKKAAAKPAAKPATTRAAAAKPAAKPAARTAAKTAAAPKKVVTVTLRQLAAELAEAHGMTKKQTEAVLGDLVTMTTKRLKKGEKVRFTGLGTMEVRKRPARMGRNPATGEAIKIKASKKVAFRVAKELKESV